MNLFFGKISNKYDVRQLSEGYYEAPLGSSWFGSLAPGDYVYLIGGQKIQFWRAKEWQTINDKNRMTFDILSTDLGLNTNQLIALNFFTLDKALMVLTSRSSRIAFFPIKYNITLNPDNLSNPAYYQDYSLYRNIVLKNKELLNKSSNDIQLYFENDDLSIYKASFFDPEALNQFRDNAKFIGRGAKNKDNTIRSIIDQKDKGKVFSYSELGLRSFYDAFFCDYKEKVVKDNDEPIKYWLYSPGEQAYKWMEFYQDNIVALGWDELEDLNNYKNKDEISQALKLSYGGDTKKTNDANANYDFLNTMDIGDIIIVKKGSYTLLGYGRISSDYFYDDSREDYIHCRSVEWTKKGEWEIDHSMVQKTLTDITDYDKTNGESIKYYKYLIDIMNNNTLQNNKNISLINLLQYKKQIILQGPPGTGKTREAKLIAQNIFINEFLENLSSDFSYNLKSGTTASIKSLKDNQIELNLSTPETKSNVIFSKEEVYESFISNDFKKNDFVDYRKYCIRSLVFFILNEAKKDQFKLIQFHPSYTYEDFVRGIVAKPNPDGEGVIYEAENKTVAQFAEEALKNYTSSQPAQGSIKISGDQVRSDLDLFITHVIESIDKDEKYAISENVYIFYVDDKRFKYKGDNWERHAKGLNMNFSELKKIIEKGISERSDIVKEQTLNALTRSHATYYTNIIEKYKDFIATKSSEATATYQTPKNYVLIIDEINRANLSSVLGELIYALEYRGEAVESMYEVGDSNKLTLPPNLYIIGTMNTADRSVGHIDYAIRRRFAFVDVLPKELQDDEEIYFNNQAFSDVSALFNDQNVSKEFEIDAVQIGHSYFIVKKKDAENEARRDELFNLKMQYEIKPILLEYERDGILIGEYNGQPIKDYIKSL